jgi:hypothetical protein
MSTFVDMWYLKRYAGDFADLHGDIHRFDAARDIHEKLSEYLGEAKTMGGAVAGVAIQEEEKEGELVIKEEEKEFLEDIKPKAEEVKAPVY